MIALQRARAAPLAAWERIESELKVVKLTPLVILLVPVFAIPALPKSTRGVTLYPGRMGIGLGMLLVASSVFAGLLLAGPLGVVGLAVPLWLMGTVGGAMIAGGVMPIAFVKPICVECRLLPIIREHEAIHLAGVASEKAVWASMKERHSVQSLSLEGDPAICTFCPIPKRLAKE
jgi:hypothetical protein